MSFFPRVVGLDTDWTIWQNYLDGQTWGKGAGASRIQEDNIERIDQWTLRDRTNHAYRIKAFNDISKVINDILKNGAQLAIITRNPAKNLSDRALYYFKAINPAGGNQRSIIELIKYNEAKDESKALPWRRIREKSGSDYADFLMFDDEALNNATRIIVVNVELAVGNKPIDRLRIYTHTYLAVGNKPMRCHPTCHTTK